jgi:aryl-alcohol dehydrogenase-like predicted oxidoreductase
MRITGAGIWGWPPDRDNALKVLKRAVELGANLIDTADAYGPETSELLIAEALYPYPKDLVIATKGGNTRPGPGQWVPNGRPEYLSQCVDKSLKRLRLERIDLYQLHRIDPKVPMEDSLGALKKAQDAGKIRHVGLSEVSPEEIERARKVLPIATVQNQYNIDNRKWENALTYCEKEGIGFMPWSPIGGNRGLHDNALEAAAKDYHASMVQLALAWLLHQLARDVANSRHVFPCAPRGEHGGGQAQVDGVRTGSASMRWQPRSQGTAVSTPVWLRPADRSKWRSQIAAYC